MQSETGFPSSLQLKSYVAYKSRPPEIGGARCPVSGCWPSCYGCGRLNIVIYTCSTAPCCVALCSSLLRGTALNYASHVTHAFGTSVGGDPV